MVIHVLLWDMARSIQPHHPIYLKSFMFSMSLSTYYLWAPSQRPYFALSHYFLTITPFMTCLGHEARRGLYQLVPDHLPPSLSCLLSSTNSALQWHWRIGLPTISKLFQALSWIFVSSFECESCQLEKHCWASYPCLDFITSKSLFDLVHCDVWGPSRVPSILGFCCYIIFVDNLFHASWIYLLKNLTDVMPSIHLFLQEISTQYSKTPKKFHTDNALEFVKTAIQDLCISHGILCQTTCLYTSQ